MDTDEPLSPAGYLRHLSDLYTGARTLGEIDPETGLLVGWDEPPWSVIQKIRLADDA